MDFNEFKRTQNVFSDSTGNVFVGDDMILKKMLCAALAGGHVLFEDNPGLGKTLLAKVFAKVSGCVWGRVQFTPDMMPADILGTRVWMNDNGSSRFELEKGPVFTNILTGRRDQPGAPEDTIGAPRGDGRKAGDHRRDDAYARKAVLRHRHGKPH